MLRRQSGTPPLRNQVIQHHLILQIITLNLSFSAVLLNVCVCGRETERGVEREIVGERGRPSGLSQSDFFPTYFVSCNGPCAPKEKWHRKDHIIIIIIITNQSSLPCSCVSFCLYGPFHCISFHKFSRQLSAFSLCSSGLISAVLVLSTIYLFMKVSFRHDIILCG